MIRVSVITVNLNNVQGLRKTIQSVLGQTFIDKEFILIDGSSTDGSLQVVENFKSHINYWISEPDTGIYNAMNKGIQQAKGEYCLFLNSGDWLSSPTILQELLDTTPTADLVAGDVYFFDTTLNQIKWYVPSPDILTAKTLFLGTLPHQATLIKKTLFDKVGLYNENLKIASDWLFWIETLLEKDCSYQHYSGVVAYFNMDGISSSLTANSLPRLEKTMILEQKYPRFVADYKQLEQLENESKQWLSSHEYVAYEALRKWGLIKIGVLGLRVINYFKRKLTFKSQA